jgi:hypothetical protein
MTLAHIADMRRQHAAAKLLAAAKDQGPAVQLMAVAVVAGITSLARDLLVLRLAGAELPFSVMESAALLGVHPDSIRRATGELIAAQLLGPAYRPAILPDVEHRIAAGAQ